MRFVKRSHQNMENHNRLIRTRGQQVGMILPTLLIVMSIVLLMGLSLATQAMLHLNTTHQSIAISNSLYASETGAEMTLHELNDDSTFGGFSETEFLNNQDQGRVTYETNVSNGTIDDEKIITSTGRVYADGGSSDPTAVQRIRLVVVGTTSSGYDVQSGPGGLIMDNTATVANGEVYIGGYLDMDNAAQIGTLATPTAVEVAHENCPDPPDSSYPSQCSSGEPIDMSGVAHIYGDVHAVNQTDGSQMSNSGLVDQNVSDISLPDYDRQAQKDAVSDTISGSEGSCSGGESKTWQNNLKISGDVTLRNSCQITISGDVWIAGDVLLRNASRLVVDSSLASTPTVMIDGQNGLRLRNAASIIANADGVGVQFITFYADASCSPDCTSLSGTDLHNSQDIVTIDLNNSSLGAGSEFYARWSRVKVNNSGSVGTILGQSIHLSNTGTLSIGHNLSSGDQIWTIKNYQRIYQ